MRIPIAPQNRRGYYEARPGDVLGEPSIVVVDVRPDDRDLLGDFGHIHGVLHLPAEELLKNGLVSLAVDTPIALVCNNGRKSADCAEHLVRERGFSEVYVLVGGMVRWTAEERPVARIPTWTRPGPPGE